MPKSALFDCYFRCGRQEAGAASQELARPCKRSETARVLSRIDVEVVTPQLDPSVKVWRAEMRQMRSLVEAGVVAVSDFEKKVWPLLSGLWQ